MRFITLDDVSAIFDDKKAVQYLLAALGRQQGKADPDGLQPYGESTSTFEFHGGIICISNLPVTPKGMLAAFKSRVHTLPAQPDRPHASRLVPPPHLQQGVARRGLPRWA